ncbi:Uncharacterized protein ALO47_05041 [Pseudomonas syringae pv. ribicola]|uniref:Uncharacterized protein n=1 Tax=Pseudomonas syringae pv. ribicola TaxID=55398 RepID=A0A0P9YZI2_PSESI|nr:Uncharacterized protein ALO47_05041 [Pseudomonas syringae pv. ribicola]
MFAAHHIEIAAPQHSVVIFLPDERQHLDSERASLQHLTDLKMINAQPMAQVAQNASFRHQQVRGMWIAGKCIQPTAQRRVLVGKHRDQARIGPQLDTQKGEKVQSRFAVVLKGSTLFDQTALTQQAARGITKTGKEKELLQTAGLQGWQAMATGDPLFGAEVVEIQPYRTRRALQHRVGISRWETTRKGLDHAFRNLGTHPLFRPEADLNTFMPLLRDLSICLRTQASECRQIIDPQTYLQPMLGDQLASQSPCHADVAVVVDDAAKNVPRGFHPGSLRQSKKKCDCPSEHPVCTRREPLRRLAGCTIVIHTLQAWHNHTVPSRQEFSHAVPHPPSRTVCLREVDPLYRSGHLARRDGGGPDRLAGLQKPAACADRGSGKGCCATHGPARAAGGAGNGHVPQVRAEPA